LKLCVISLDSGGWCAQCFSFYVHHHSLFRDRDLGSSKQKSLPVRFSRRVQTPVQVQPFQSRLFFSLPHAHLRLPYSPSDQSKLLSTPSSAFSTVGMAREAYSLAGQGDIWASELGSRTLASVKYKNSMYKLSRWGFLFSLHDILNIYIYIYIYM
jgi:hypothetical protein